MYELTLLILFMCASVGLTCIVVDSVIADPFRRFVNWGCISLLRKLNCQPSSPWYTQTARWFLEKPPEALDCHQCSGFWCGLICGYILISPNFLVVFMCGFASSALSMMTVQYRVYLEHNSMVDIDISEKD